MDTPSRGGPVTHTGTRPLMRAWNETVRVGPSPGQADINVIFGELCEIRPERGREGAALHAHAHVTWDGFGPARASPEEATDAAQQAAGCLYGCGHSLGFGGEELGYRAPSGLRD